MCKRSGQEVLARGEGTREQEEANLMQGDREEGFHLQRSSENVLPKSVGRLRSNIAD